MTLATERAPLNPKFLRLHIRSTLQLLNMWSVESEELLIGTCAQESHLGTYRRQIGGGPGTGIYQIEPTTERSLWIDHLAFRPSLATAITNICGVRGPDIYQLEYNLAYQHIIARLRYRAWVKAPIPMTLHGQAEYWDKYYNCNPDAGTPAEYISNYRRLVSQ